MMEAQYEDLKKRLNQVFCEVFENDSLRITEATTARDIEGWDSLTHVNLIIAVEKRFKVSLSTKDVSALRNVGDFIRLVERKLL